MRIWSETMSDWLVDYYALTTVVLVAALVVMGRLRQPVRRLSVARSAFVGLAMLAVLAALPGWPRASWRGQPGPAQPDRPAIAAASGQDSGITTDTQLGIRPEPRDAMPTGPPLPVGHEQSIRSGDESIRSAIGISVRIPAVEWISNRLDLVGRAFVAGGALLLVWLGIGLWQTAVIRRQSWRAPTGRETCWQTSSATAGLCRTCSSPAGWPSPSRSACCGRPSFSPSGSSTTSRDAGSRPRWRNECAHFRNRDLWWIVVSGLLMPVLFAHPVYWWLRRRAREDSSTNY